MPNFLALAVRKGHREEKDTHISLSHIREYAFLIGLKSCQNAQKQFCLLLL